MMAVRKMTAVREIQAENSIAGLQDGSIGFHVRLRSGVRLHVGVLGAEQLLGAVASEVLDDVGELAATVVALAGISLGVFIREDGARGFEHGFADEVLRGNQFEAFVLAASFVVDRSGDLRIAFVKRAVHFCELIFHIVFLISYTSGRCSSM